eukprot:388169_1
MSLLSQETENISAQAMICLSSARNYSPIHPLQKKKEASESAGVLLNNFQNSIINTRKPMICGVNGPAIGIAVTMLGIMDIVYASNTATFHTPFSALGQSPEGLSSITFVQKMGLSNANELLLLGKKNNCK